MTIPESPKAHDLPPVEPSSPAVVIADDVSAITQSERSTGSASSRFLSDVGSVLSQSLKILKGQTPAEMTTLPEEDRQDIPLQVIGSFQSDQGQEEEIETTSTISITTATTTTTPSHETHPKQSLLAMESRSTF